MTGPGNSQSSLTKGWTDLDGINANGNGTVKGFDYNFNLGAKVTNDRNNDIRDFSVTNLQGRLTNKTHTVNAGDTFESFSQYALNTSLKGASYKYSGASLSLPEVTVLYGYAFARWDSIKWFFANRAADVRAIDREVFGSRVKQSIGDLFWVGMSYVSSVDRSRLTPASEADSNKAVTGDWEYRPIPGATLSGEHSFGFQRDSPSEGAADILHRGYAHRITAVGDADPSRVSLEYELVSPYFTTLVGAATPDREKFKGGWRYKLSRDLTARTGFLWFHDDLEKQLAGGRTDNYKPDVGLTVKRLLGRQYASLDLGCALDQSAKHGRVDRDDHIVNANYRDRFGFLDSDSNLGYTTRRTAISSPSRTRNFTYNTALSSRHTLESVILKPSVRLGGWATRDELATTTQQQFEYSGGLGVDVPDWKVTSDIRVGENRLQRSDANDTAKLFASANVYYRPARLEKMQGMLFLRAFMNQFRFSTSGQDFRETSVSAGLNVQL